MKKGTLAQVFSCKFWGIFKKTFFTENHHDCFWKYLNKNVVKQY